MIFVFKRNISTVIVIIKTSFVIKIRSLICLDIGLINRPESFIQLKN